MNLARDEVEQPAPMAASPNGNPGPAVAAAAQYETGDWRRMTEDDVDDFMDTTKRAMGQEKFLEFEGLLQQIDSIGAKAIWERMKVLFRGHPDVKRHLNLFLPTQHKLSLTDDGDLEEEALTDSLYGSVID